MERRDFLKGAAAAAVLAGVMKPLSAAEEKKAEKGDEKLIEVHGEDPAAMFDCAIAELGGMSAFVKPGQSVVIKPNIGWDREAETGADTNPDLVGRIVRRVKEAGASHIFVFDHTCDRDYLSCYKKSGIRAAVEKNGGQMIPGNRQADYRKTEIKGAVALKKAEIHKAILEADVVIDGPVLKHHGGAKMTAAMKNWMGIIWDRRYMHKNGLHQCIADLVLARKPDLCILDAYRVMLTGGPTGRARTSRSVLKKMLLASRDIVALDCAACKLLGASLADVRHIELGGALGIGKLEPSETVVKKLS